MRQSYKNRKEIAKSKGTCKYHINDSLVEGRCARCDANYVRRKTKHLEHNFCIKHVKVQLSDGTCFLCQKNYKNRKEKLKKEGKCQKHSNIVLVAGNCSRCEDNYIYSKEIGTCTRHLDTLLVEGKCNKCLSYSRKSRRDLSLSMLCVHHPQISIKNGPCLLCKDSYNNKKLKALAEGKCLYHPSTPSVTGMMCFECWCASIAGDALGSKKMKNVIKESFLKNPFCFFTGVRLLPGHERTSASIDHIIPISRGGSKTIENCQWVQLFLNVSKNNKTNDEYFSELIHIEKVRNKPFPILEHLSSNNVYHKPDILCSRCKSTKYKNPCAAEIASYCQKHYFETISLKFFNTVKYATDLYEKFLRQGGLCLYSKQRIVLGSDDRDVGASLDHTVPLSRGGTSDINNLEWVSRRTNVLKQTMTVDELFDLAVTFRHKI